MAYFSTIAYVFVFSNVLKYTGIDLFPSITPHQMQKNTKKHIGTFLEVYRYWYYAL